ncbi:MAG: hypothetical protein H6613_02630 [Ignavibacteriales bacterium]|nr:hypothetical protein [Ignavibacteriales bacterium]
MKTNIKNIILLLLLLSCSINASRVVGGPLKNLTIWRHWSVENGIATEKISFYNSDSIEVKLSAKLFFMKNDYQKDDSTVVNLWNSIFVKNQSLKTLDFPSTTLKDSSRVYLSITKETRKDTIVREFLLENYFPIKEITEDGNYIPFGWANSVHLIFRIDSLTYESNKEYLIDLFVKCPQNYDEEISKKIIHLITHEKAQKFLGSKRKFSKFLDRTPIELKIDDSSKENLLLGASDFGDIIDLIGEKYNNYSKVHLKITLPNLGETKVIGAAFMIQKSEGNISFNQLNLVVH